MISKCDSVRVLPLCLIVRVHVGLSVRARGLLHPMIPFPIVESCRLALETILLPFLLLFFVETFFLFSLYDSRDNFAITFEIQLDPKSSAIKEWEIYPSRITRIHHLQSQCYLAPNVDIRSKSGSKKQIGTKQGNSFEGKMNFLIFIFKL